MNTIPEPYFEFEWTVAPAYEWSDFLDKTGKPVVAPSEGLVSLESSTAVERAWERFERMGKGTGPLLRPVSESSKPRQYHPMRREHAALFRIFAALDYRDREAIRGFANTYGLLGVPSKNDFGEPYLTWAREICLMQEALKLEQPATAAAEAQHRAFLSRQGWDAEDFVERRRRERREKLTWLFNVHLQHVQGRMTFDPDVAPLLEFAPLTLLAAMWLQLALAVAGNKEFVKCKFCERQIEISTAESGFRSNRVFCSQSCKTKDYRKRKRDAIRLAHQGKTVRAIAKLVATRPETLRGWLVASKKRKTVGLRRSK